MVQHQQPSLPEAMAQPQQHQQRAVTALQHQQRAATVLHHLRKQVVTALLLHRHQEAPLQGNKRSSDYGAIKQYAMDSR
jgi:hypothetical protein